MGRMVLGIVLASIVMFFWGFLFWGINPYAYHAWRPVEDHETAAAALLRQFSERGTYYVPEMIEDRELLESRFEAGPLAFVHMIDVDGRPMFDPTIMLQGFVLNTVVIMLIALFLHQALPALPTYGRRFGHAGLAGLAAVVFIDCGDAVWWQIPWDWKLMQASYDLSAWIVAAAVLSAFIRPTAGIAESD